MTLTMKPTDISTKHTSGFADSAHAWFYEERAGLEVVVQHTREDGTWSTTTHVVPWARIRQSLARKDKKRLAHNRSPRGDEREDA